MKVIDVVQDIAEVIELGNGKKLTASQFLQHFLFTRDTAQLCLQAEWGDAAACTYVRC